MNADSEFESDDERGSEVDDYTGEVPTVEHRDPDTHAEGPQPSGFGDGDVADVDESEFGLPADMFDLDAVIERKIRENEQKYPVDKAKGNATKYTEL